MWPQFFLSKLSSKSLASQWPLFGSLNFARCALGLGWFVVGAQFENLVVLPVLESASPWRACKP